MNRPVAQILSAAFLVIISVNAINNK